MGGSGAWRDEGDRSEGKVKHRYLTPWFEFSYALGRIPSGAAIGQALGGRCTAREGLAAIPTNQTFDMTWLISFGTGLISAVLGAVVVGFLADRWTVWFGSAASKAAPACSWPSTSCSARWRVSFSG